MATLISLDPGRLDGLMPMHVLISSDGIVRHAGPTLVKVHPGRRIVGEAFFSLFELRRPAMAADIVAVCRTAGAKVSLRLRDPDRTPVTVWLPIAHNDPPGRWTVTATDVYTADTQQRLQLAVH